MRRPLLAAALAALVLAPAAFAHVTVLPAYLEDGRRATLAFAMPNERPGHAVTRVTLTVPTGFELTTAPSPPGWRLRIDGRKATWSGGRIASDESRDFLIAAMTEIAPTAVTLLVMQHYDDGGFVRWTIPFTVLPASAQPKEYLWPALGAGAAGLAVIVGGLALLRLRRRRATT